MLRLCRVCEIHVVYHIPTCVKSMRSCSEGILAGFPDVVASIRVLGIVPRWQWNLVELRIRINQLQSGHLTRPS